MAHFSSPSGCNQFGQCEWALEEQPLRASQSQPEPLTHPESSCRGEGTQAQGKGGVLLCNRGLPTLPLRGLPALSPPASLPDSDEPPDCHSKPPCVLWSCSLVVTAHDSPGIQPAPPQLSPERLGSAAQDAPEAWEYLYLLYLSSIVYSAFRKYLDPLTFPHFF